MRLVRKNKVVVCSLVTVMASVLAIAAAAMPARLSTDGLSAVIREAPPAPSIDEKERLAELAQRRQRVSQSIGPNAMLLLFSAEPRVYTNDVDYEYRQENNLFYLTNLKQKGATLAVISGNPQLPEILFLPRRSPVAETWTGHMYSPEEALRISGVKEIWEDSELQPFLQAVRLRQPYRPKPEKLLLSATVEQPGTTSGFESLFGAAGKNEALIYLLIPGEHDSREYKQEQRFAAEWAKLASGYSVRNATPIFSDMRLRKSDLELRLLQHAIDITTEAQERAWIAAGSAKWEYEVDAHVAYTYKLRNADHWGYPSIVGCGPNATTLHYEESQGPVRPGDLLLMDVGAEYEHYTADVTRTFPVNGKFSPSQSEIYEIVYDAQEAGARTIRPGSYVSDVHRAATEVIKDGLLKLGLITDKNSEQYHLWFMHGTSHWLGMNVHDVGNYGTKLEPGMVFTLEPGIYIRPDALDYRPSSWSLQDWEKFKNAVLPAFEKFKGIGVRIEDDMLVTKDGSRWLTEALPREMAAIEKLIARGRAARE
jgi:Xaa-Pro aminopeptidase